MPRATLVAPILSEIPNPAFEHLSWLERSWHRDQQFIEEPVDTTFDVEARSWQIALSTGLGEAALALHQRQPLKLLAAGVARACVMVAPAAELAVTTEAIDQMQRGLPYRQPASIDVVPRILEQNVSLRAQIAD